MMARMDYNFGKILDTANKLGIADDTIVRFPSDNGGAYECNNGPLKGGKTDLREGGIRVAGLARWPGQIKAGAGSGVLGHTNDLLPTLCAAAGAKIPGDAKLDGVNLLPQLTGKAESVERDTTFWQIRPYRSMQRHDPNPKPYATEIAREWKWKLLAKGGESVEVFDIDANLAEEHNVLEGYPEIPQQLQKELQG